jgi:hypothetical protein
MARMTRMVRMARSPGGEELVVATFLRKPTEFDTLVETVEAYCQAKGP